MARRARRLFAASAGGRVRAADAGLCQCRDRAPLFLRAHRLVRRAAWLGRAQRALSRPRRAPARDAPRARRWRGADVAPDAVDTVVCVSTTGIATPSLDAMLIERLGLRPGRAAAAGIRAGLCRRRDRPGACCRTRPRRARDARALPGGGAVRTRLPQGRHLQEQHRRDRALRRRRGGGAHLVPRRGSGLRRRRRIHLAAIARP